MASNGNAPWSENGILKLTELIKCDDDDHDESWIQIYADNF